MHEIFDTAIGRVSVEHSEGGIKEIHLGARGTATEPRSAIAKDLRRYFAGDPVDFSRYEVDLSGFTDFQRKVYGALRSVPRGEVRTYGELAREAGRPGAARAVGNAMARNPACIVIPCHRVVGTGGLGGFTGGLAWKRKLLRLEGALESAERAKERR
jgi:methylated-DNA-[protein]-cysteine S-methyltransferase